METTTENGKRDVYQIVTDRIIVQLEKGTAPWRQNWRGAEIPANLITSKKYRGINVLLLSSLGFVRNYFLTFHQLEKLGGCVMEGEKPCPVVYWKTFEETSDAEEAEEKRKRKLVPRYYNVYNIAQCEGIPEENFPPLLQEMEKIQSCENMVMNMPDRPEIRHGDTRRAFYSPGHDTVNMPPIVHFANEASYYETLFHELIHSTGHPKRLNRKELSDPASGHCRSYFMEELTAEIGACFLKGFAGIKCGYSENNMTCIQIWLNLLRNNNRFIVHACIRAQKAVDFILNAGPNGKKEVFL